MSITALVSTGQQTRSIDKNPRLFLNVMTWEFRRFCASRLFWFQALGFFCLLLLLTWAEGMADGFSTRNFSGFIAGTSTWGLLLTLPTTLLLLVLLLPFVSADGVTRDQHRRTHELLLTTPLPTWAYVWGRYLTGLLQSLGLALLLLVAILGMGGLLHLTTPAYPLPQIGAVLLLWVGMVLPATVLVSSLSFAFSTLFPRQTNLVKIVIMVAWVVGAEVLPTVIYFPAGPNGLPVWYSNWDPTSALTALVMFSQYSFGVTLKNATSAAQFQQMLLAVENKMPTIGSWFAPHLLLVGCSLVLVLIAALAFKRSRGTLS